MTIEGALTIAVSAEAVAIGVLWREVVKVRKMLAISESRRAEAWETVARRGWSSQEDGHDDD